MTDKNFKYDKGVESIRQTAVIIILLSAIAGHASANDSVLRLNTTPSYWALPGGNYSNWRYSGLGQINNKNAGKLKLAWTYATGNLGNHVSGPLVVPAAASGQDVDTLFLSTPYPNEVLAIGLDDLGLRWSYRDPGEAAEGCCQSLNSGISYANSRIYLQQDDLILVAINARNGRAAWRTRTGFGLQDKASINSPYPIGDFILTNNIDVNGVSVSTGAHRINDGSLAWKAGSVGSDTEILFNAATSHLGVTLPANSSLTSWQTEQFPLANYHPWTLLAWDSQQNLVFYGSPADNQTDSERRPGTRRWTSSIIARDLNTGMARWVYQMTPNNEWGFNGTNQMLLADLVIDGLRVPALVHFDQNGFVYVLNRLTGSLIKADKYDASVNWASQVNLTTGLPEINPSGSRFLGNRGTSLTVCPSPVVGKTQSPLAFSPRTGLAYVPTAHACSVVEQGRRSVNSDFDSGILFNEPESPVERVIPAGMITASGSEHMGTLTAWDPAAGKTAWQIQERWPVKSGVLATAGDVVFYGTLDGYVRLVDAKTGALLWQFRVPSGVAGSFSSWMYKGKQYVGVLSGINPAKLDELGLVGESFDALAAQVRAGGSLMVFSLP